MSGVLLANRLLSRLLKLPRRWKQVLMVGADLVLMALVTLSAFALRLGQAFSSPLLENWWLLVALPLVSVPLFAAVRLYHSMVRYMGPRAVLAVVYGVSLSTLAFWAIVMLVGVHGVPRTTYVIYWLMGLLLVGGSRVLVRAWFQAVIKRNAEREPVAIYGAGAAGVQLANSLLATREHEPVAFLDDDPALQRSVINGIPVKSPEVLPRLVRREGVRHVLLAMPSVPRGRRREIVQSLEPYPVHIRTIPGMVDLVSGAARLQDIREVEIDDVLGRDAVEPDQRLLECCIQDRVVMVTGAGGSIGSELCRQILTQEPRKLLLFEQSEFALYRISQELQAVAQANGIGCEIVSLLGSVAHQRRLERVMAGFAVETVYHAAAYKHVPIVEENVLEGVQNNVFGTYRAAMAAGRVGVKWFVLVSTDKAVRPPNVMGATKRFAELVLQALADNGSSTCYSMVRFGNVLDSSGSVVPLFREQISKGGPVTVTHQEVTRYFMTIPEAASLVIQAGSMAEGGEVFVLDMGDPVKIDDLARRMIHLSGYTVADDDTPDGDVRIVYTGLRPGEKLYEELLLGESVSGTAHPMIMRASEASITWSELDARMKRFDAACRAHDSDAAREVLRECVDGYDANTRSNDLLTVHAPHVVGSNVPLLSDSPPSQRH
ncbi:polysaccharide biosynthesis protein [Aquisalimonas sp. APHAB1-3]|uniref:polysaccharide biosynthesis protein n=1 Tax=Aquisalimonas sp. APHAB1-3 TaxID=3402080 RepID=UPI003AAD9E3A